MPKYIDTVGQIALLIYIVTFYWIVRSVRKHHRLEVKDAVTNPFLPNLNLKFIPWVYKNYINVRGSAVLPAISITSFFVALVVMLISVFQIGQ